LPESASVPFAVRYVKNVFGSSEMIARAAPVVAST